MDYKDYFAGKKVTLMGLGLLGRGVGDARFLAPLCKELIVTDLKKEVELKSSLGQLKEFSNIVFHLGGHWLQDFQTCDLVVKAAGVPLDSPFIAEAKKNNIPVRMSADLFAEFVDAPIVGVTGTRGKSTVAHLIAHTLKKAEKRVLLGGNVRNLSTLALLKEVTPEAIAVLELDSWQLQGFGEAKKSPHIAVFTNLLPDHLNYYGGDMQKYFADKANIYRFQHEGDHLLVGVQVAERVLKDNPPIAPVVPKKIPQEWQLKIVGVHNKENAALAAEALRALGLSEEQIKEGFESFEPIEGRLQLLREINGVKIYNDNNATTPEATIAALSAFEPSKTILIVGGADKGLETEALTAQMGKCKKVLLLEGSGTERLKLLLKNPTIYGSVLDALKDAYSAAQPSDVILFSPAFASFGIFKNEYDRNDQFVAVVKDLA